MGACGVWLVVSGSSDVTITYQPPTHYCEMSHRLKYVDVDFLLKEADREAREMDARLLLLAVVVCIAGL